jgi:hypothetical protein
VKIRRVVDPTAPVMDIYTARQDGQAIGTIAMCTRDRIHAATAISWLMSDYSFLGQGEHVSRFIVQGHVLTLQRNQCIQRMQGDWIIFIDDDMTWQPDAIKALVASHQKHQLDMVGGLCFQRGDPYQPTLYMREQPTSGSYIFMEDIPEDSLVEVDATGMAFVLISRRLLEAIAGEFPPLEERVARRPPAYFRWDANGFGEDLTFCQDAKLAGAKIFVDTSIKIGHVGEHTITERTFLTSLATRPDDITEKRREILSGMGLGTVDRAEAARRLERLNGMG